MSYLVVLRSPLYTDEFIDSDEIEIDNPTDHLCKSDNQYPQSYLGIFSDKYQATKCYDNALHNSNNIGYVVELIFVQNEPWFNGVLEQELIRKIESDDENSNDENSVKSETNSESIIDENSDDEKN
jgi:hypothetical protein